MPSEPNHAGSPEEWLRYARSDLELARMTPSPDILLETLCFHAQQTVEKSLKAVLIARGIEAPRTHNIRRLLDLLPSTQEIPEEIQTAAALTDYAVVACYPGDLEPVEDAEYQEAIQIAETVLIWAENMIIAQAEQSALILPDIPPISPAQEDENSSQIPRNHHHAKFL